MPPVKPLPTDLDPEFAPAAPGFDARRARTAGTPGAPC